MDKTALKKALETYNANPLDAGAQKIIAKYLGTLAVIHRVDDNKVDVQETIDSAEFARAQGMSGEHGCITAQELFAQASPPTPADPISGAPLRKGKTTTYPIVDWNPVPEPRRLTAAYAAEVGQVPAGGSEMAAFQLKQPTLQPPWDRLDKEAQELDEGARANKLPAERRALWERCRARLQKDRAPATPAAQPTPAPAAPPAPARRTSGAPDPNDDFAQPRPAAPTAPSAPSAPATFVLAHEQDRRYADDLITHLFTCPGTRTTNLRVPAGYDYAAYVRAQVASSAAIVMLVSPDFLASEDLMEIARHARDQGKHIMPWVIRPCLWADSIFGSVQPLRGDAFAASSEISGFLRPGIARGRRWG